MAKRSLKAPFYFLIYDMNKEEKELLLKDLCARLSYGIKIKTPRGIYTVDAVSSEGLFSISNDDKTLDDLTPHDGHYWLPITGDYKPYLRPMESMTEEEERWYGNKIESIKESVIRFPQHVSELMCWLDKKMFDYRGLIPMGLALTAEEGMYNN